MNENEKTETDRLHKEVIDWINYHEFSIGDLDLLAIKKHVANCNFNFPHRHSIHYINGYLEGIFNLNDKRLFGIDEDGNIERMVVDFSPEGERKTGFYDVDKDGDLIYKKLPKRDMTFENDIKIQLDYTIELLLKSPKWLSSNKITLRVCNNCNDLLVMKDGNCQHILIEQCTSDEISSNDERPLALDGIIFHTSKDCLIIEHNEFCDCRNPVPITHYERLEEEVR
jgi:hypothetical protein